MSNEKTAKKNEKLKRILEAILKMTSGDLGVELPVENIDDPIDGIASVINTLAHRLRETTVSRDYFNTIIASMPDSLIVLDRLGYISHANEATAKLLGLDLSLLTGLHFSRICPVLYTNGASGFTQLRRSRGADPLEVDYVGQGGRLIPVSFSASALSQASNRGRGWVCTAQDLRSRKSLENSLRQKDHLLAHSSKMAALGEMAAGIAHEINNPISIIAGRAEQIREIASSGAFESALVLRAVDRIEATTRRVAKIISGLRTFARDADHDPFEIVKVKGLVDETIALCGERFKHHGVDLRVDDIHPTLDLECRAVQISQVLVNLLNNAFDAVQGQKERWVHVSILDHDDEIELAVTDSGPGIPKEIRLKIMQPFYSTKETGKGTGLGLSIASGILGAHRGGLALDETSVRTRFLVRLPRRQVGTVIPKSA